MRGIMSAGNWSILNVTSGRSSALAGKMIISSTHKSSLNRDIEMLLNRMLRSLPTSAIDSLGDLVQGIAINWIAESRGRRRQHISLFINAELVLVLRPVRVLLRERHLK